MNVLEKILARASGQSTVEPGQIVVANVDLMVLHDLSANFVARVFTEELPDARVAHPERIAFVFDHTFSPPTERAACVLDDVRRFARTHGIRQVFDSGAGSLHHVIIEHGLWAPGQVIVGCDSHTTVYGALGAFATGIGNNSMAALGFTRSQAWLRVPETIKVVLHGHLGDRVSPRDVAQHLVGRLGEDGAVYAAVEYAGAFIDGLEIEERMLFPLMAIDLGAKAGFINPDARLVEFARRHSSATTVEVVANDADVNYRDTFDLDVSVIEPQVACPPTVGQVVPVMAVAGEPIHVAEVGGSTGGRLTDLRTLARYLRGRRLALGVRLQVVPTTRATYRRAIQDGIIETLLDAGATIFPPGAGSNQAVNMGALAPGEVMISTQARNFPGRNGSLDAKHYLASAATVAASALAGRIADPRSVPL